MSCLSAGKNISDEKASSMTQFFDSMPAILPCRQCGKHLRENLLILPFDREDPFQWSVNLHNLVNSQLNKSEIDYDKALRYWSTKCSGNIDTQWIIGVLIVFIILFFIFMNRRGA